METSTASLATSLAVLRSLLLSEVELMETNQQQSNQFYLEILSLLLSEVELMETRTDNTDMMFTF